MRNFIEPTARNLLRKPTVFGVPLLGLVALAFVVITIELFGNGTYGNISAIAIGAIGYVVLRIFHRFSKPGWEEELAFPIEKFLLLQNIKKTKKKNTLKNTSNTNQNISLTVPPAPLIQFYPSEEIETLSKDTLGEIDFIRAKEIVLERILALKPKESFCLLCDVSRHGTKLFECKTVPGLKFSQISESYLTKEKSQKKSNIKYKTKLDFKKITGNFLESNPKFIYSLYRLPVTTDPVWISNILSNILSSCLNQDAAEFKVIVSMRGCDPFEIKSRIETSRKRNSRDSSRVSNIDAEVTFNEASKVLTGLSSGDECIVELSLVILFYESSYESGNELSNESSYELDQKKSQKNSNAKLNNIDPSFFCLEKEKIHELSLSSIFGLRHKFHRSHFVRAVSASDLIPQFLDPKEEGSAILTTLRGKPLYFSPADKRLEALHWVVVGASGSGKSFFTGLVIRRMLKDTKNTPLAALFIDHNRSFRRMIRNESGTYLEPQDLRELNESVEHAFLPLNKIGHFSGIELSDLSFNEKTKASHYLLSKLEEFLRQRTTSHP
ncbi:MAG: hypothetical protein HY072_05880, partial [Deltaproteobacteria bacterium]|nr:hypothetical protein [Deltaproteobacteria bacterium]